MLFEELEKRIEEKYKRAKAKQKVAKELLQLAGEGVKSPRGGLWSLFKKLGYHNAYAQYWYKHAKVVLGDFQELKEALNVKF